MASVPTACKAEKATELLCTSHLFPHTVKLSKELTSRLTRVVFRLRESPWEYRMISYRVLLLTRHVLRIFQRNGLKLDRDLIFSGLVQNVYVYRMAKSKKI